MMKVAHIVRDTDAEGPGRRFAIWTRGCSLKCPRCCNPELFASGGPDTPVQELLAAIGRTQNIEGISVLGGEPTEQPDLLALCRGARALGLTVMVYSGHRLEELEQLHPALLSHIDLLVDGRYEHARRSDQRRFIGSDNQRLHHLTDAYEPSDARLHGSQTVELRLVDGVLTVNGWPDGAKGVPS